MPKSYHDETLEIPRPSYYCHYLVNSTLSNV